MSSRTTEKCEIQFQTNWTNFYEIVLIVKFLQVFANKFNLITQSESSSWNSFKWMIDVLQNLFNDNLLYVIMSITLPVYSISNEFTCKLTRRKYLVRFINLLPQLIAILLIYILNTFGKMFSYMKTLCIYLQQR